VIKNEPNRVIPDRDFGRNLRAFYVRIAMRRREAMNQEISASNYHDSEAGDVYDLYNACNGVMLDGLLDVRKLDELSHEETEVFDVERLREVWAHTAGCADCEKIVQILNSARGLLCTEADEMAREPLRSMSTHT
jgi:hypothetical protein